MPYTVPNDLANLTPQDAAPVQENFTYVETGLNTLETSFNTVTADTARIGCRVSRNSNLSCTGAGASTPINWDTEAIDNGGFITTPSTTFTVPASKGGVYTFTVHVIGAANWSAGTYVHIISQGVNYKSYAISTQPEITATVNIDLNPTDTISVNVVNAGSTQNCTARAVLARVSV